MNTATIRDQFPICQTKIGLDKKPLIYLDHAASTHAPKPVLNAYLKVMEQSYANVHRGKHELSCLSTDMFEEVPTKVARFVGINNLQNSGKQVVLTTNTTSSLDLASHIFEDQEGKVLTTFMEHHSNDLPHRRRGEVDHVEVLPNGILDMDQMEKLLSTQDYKLVAVSGGSNVTGYMPDIHKIARMAHDAGAKILVDGAQRLAHKKLDVKPLDHPEHIDFLAGAGHKTYAPFGSAFLLGTTEIMDATKPYIPAGGTVKFVGDDDAIFTTGADRHQPGTPNIAGAIAMGTALDFLGEIGLDWVRKHELELMEPVLNRFTEMEEISVLGDIPLDKKLGVIAFNIKGYHHEKLAELLDHNAGIAVRNGCFCAHPYLFRLLGTRNEERDRLKEELQKGNEPTLPGAVRASIGIYNTPEEMDKLVAEVDNLRQAAYIEQ